MKKKTIGQAMRKHPVKEKFISIYRISLIRDRQVKFNPGKTANSNEAHLAARKMIEKYGQPDREQFYVILINTTNEIIGINMVSTGDVCKAIIHPREVFKPAILANASAMILCHNHPSGNVKPSPEDIAMTKNMVAASKIMGIQIHEHLIISMDSNEYYSMADNGMIKDFYDAARVNGVM